MTGIKSIYYQKILNSHVEFTHEFFVELDNGSVGQGSSPQGESISIYEDRAVAVDPKRIVEIIKQDQYLNKPVDQIGFDDYLQRKIDIFGRNNTFAISLAFYNAVRNTQSHYWRDKKVNSKSTFPRLCLNILNGGKYAYTNPVLSDFPEYLLIPKSTNIVDVIRDHKIVQEKIRERLSTNDKVVINGNLVNEFSVADNRLCIELLLNVLEEVNLTNKFELMIDASAGDLWEHDKYKFSLTDNSLRSSSEMCLYWLDLIGSYNIKFLEDPFHETDFESWTKLTNEQTQCNIIGDNLYSSDFRRIQEGIYRKYTNGVVIKPNQAGTVSATARAIKTAQNNNQIVITSHRSISTESTFLSAITSILQVNYIKIGPLYTDYSSIVRLNELLRLTGSSYE